MLLSRSAVAGRRRGRAGSRRPPGARKGRARCGARPRRRERGSPGAPRVHRLRPGGGFSAGPGGEARPDRSARRSSLAAEPGARPRLSTGACRSRHEPGDQPVGGAVRQGHRRGPGERRSGRRLRERLHSRGRGRIGRPRPGGRRRPSYTAGRRAALRSGAVRAPPRRRAGELVDTHLGARRGASRTSLRAGARRPRPTAVAEIAAHAARRCHGGVRPTGYDGVWLEAVRTSDSAARRRAARRGWPPPSTWVPRSPRAYPSRTGAWYSPASGVGHPSSTRRPKCRSKDPGTAVR